jgi:hypothetical protein
VGVRADIVQQSKKARTFFAVEVEESLCVVIGSSSTRLGEITLT